VLQVARCLLRADHQPAEAVVASKSLRAFPLAMLLVWLLLPAHMSVVAVVIV
jgi:hypothetical protein